MLFFLETTAVSLWPAHALLVASSIALLIDTGVVKSSTSNRFCDHMASSNCRNIKICSYMFLDILIICSSDCKNIFLIFTSLIVYYATAANPELSGKKRHCLISTDTKIHRKVAMPRTSSYKSIQRRMKDKRERHVNWLKPSHKTSRNVYSHFCALVTIPESVSSPGIIWNRD